MQTKGKVGSEFVAQATTWLNQGRFERFTKGSEPQAGGVQTDAETRLAKVPESEWRSRLSVWQSRGGHWPWQQLTEPPDDWRTKVPPHLLAEIGIVHEDTDKRVMPLRRTG
ncbi:hypothetical protein MKK70_24835 [Methylobacterium sp. E-041]|uniref:hypothetical protein n=1 Tax=Methylobacterium sp. E-041 TaxID=2836573 RepID=UPI001FBA55DC|nr:hypothetical protein [Methylobacterium sp. E-041]MCJ2108536.1 hypothetical protein [Methylobacterium sp. E-041]